MNFQEKKIKLNLGCGQIRPVGWINTDSSLNALLQKLPMGEKIANIFGARTYIGKNVSYMNLNRIWKFNDESVDIVYASHLFEHLSIKNAELFLNEAYRSLKPGGVIRLVMPDLYLHAKQYVENYSTDNPAAAKDFMWALNLHREGQYHSNQIIHRLLGALQGWPHQHKYMYDQPTLKIKLVTAGFKEINFKSFGQSDLITEINEIEYDITLSYQNSLYIEAIK